MKKLFLLALLLVSMHVNSFAQYVSITNNSACDMYVTLWAWPTLALTPGPTDQTTVILVTAGSTYGVTSVSSLPWRSSGATCGSHVGLTMTEDLSCGSGGTGTNPATDITAPNGGAGPSPFYTTCTSNPSCPASTLMQVAANGICDYSYPPPTPCGPGCGGGCYDMQFVIN